MRNLSVVVADSPVKNCSLLTPAPLPPTYSIQLDNLPILSTALIAPKERLLKFLPPCSANPL